MSDRVLCSYKNECSGCQFLDLSYGEQKNLKVQELKDLLEKFSLPFQGEIQFHSADVAHLRDRLDFSLLNGNLGLYHKEHRDIVDLDICAQLSPALQEWLTEFRRLSWPLEKASFRLRVGPQGQRGAWLDMANIDVKKILDEKSLLQKLQQNSFVEIGQRRKVPALLNDQYKLQDPELQVWFQTWMGEYPVDLYCHVASFTQPSLRANKLIASTISRWTKSNAGARVIEFGSGIGNLTFPALTYAESVTACEIDELSLQGLAKTLEFLPESLKHKKEKLKIHRGDFQKKLTQDFSEFDVIMANPPRSGLQNFLRPLEELSNEKRPREFIYMSCFPESMVEDMQVLDRCGYKIQELIILDQFPQTKHYEVLTLLQRK
ncbi:23S rRNA (uracil(1939)-C(5))-methyltransferase RlmD [compost metagenome]